MLRLFVALVIAVGLAGPAVTLSDPPAAVASTGPSCTGWHSILEPPTTIRVGRRDGTVDVVKFKTYVYRVMVKEWGGMKHAASLETAAVAVKQYAWYYSLAGRWRKSYVNGAGNCYDVKDSTADQIYRDDVTITDKVRQAVDNTWGLSVRKSNKFFLTGYRSGYIYECGVDANGWKLYAKSVAACGGDGLTREEIQMIYYAPDVSFHWSSEGDTGAAAVDTAITAPKVELLSGVSFGGANTRVSWDANGQRPDGTHYQFQRVVAGVWRNVDLPDPTQTSFTLQIKNGTRQGFRVRLVDRNGNYGTWYSTGTFTPRLIQDKNDTGVLTWSNGDWTVFRSSSALADTVKRTVEAGSKFSYTFTGKGVALIGTMGPDFGRANIYVNGNYQGQVNLHAKDVRWRQIFFARQWRRSATRTVTVEIVANTGGAKFHFDAALRLP